MKNFYIAIQTKSRKDNVNKYFAYTMKVTPSDDLLAKLSDINIIYANLCGTEKKAQEQVDLWNESCIENGTFLFQHNFKDVADYRKVMGY